MTIREKYAVTGAQPVASYDWVDLTSGVGYKRYYGCASNTVTTATYFLTSKQIDAQPISLLSSAIPVDTKTKAIDLDYDIEFLRPAIIDGVAVINLTHGVRIANINSSDNETVVNIAHINLASAETIIGTTTTGVRPGTQDHNYRDCIRVALTRTHFAIGEKLRLTVELWAKDDAPGGTAKVILWFDPNSAQTVTDVDGITRNTDLILDIPFRIAI